MGYTRAAGHHGFFPNLMRYRYLQRLCENRDVVFVQETHEKFEFFQALFVKHTQFHMVGALSTIRSTLEALRFSFEKRFCMATLC